MPILPKIIKTSTKNSRVKTKKTLIVIKIKHIEQPFFKHKPYKPKITKKRIKLYQPFKQQPK